MTKKLRIVIATGDEEMNRRLEARAIDTGTRCYALRRGDKLTSRTEAIKTWENTTCAIIVIDTASGAYGHALKQAQMIIEVADDLGTPTTRQGRGRGHRSGQTTPTIVKAQRTDQPAER